MPNAKEYKSGIKESNTIQTSLYQIIFLLCKELLCYMEVAPKYQVATGKEGRIKELR